MKKIAMTFLLGLGLLSMQGCFNNPQPHCKCNMMEKCKYKEGNCTSDDCLMKKSDTIKCTKCKK